ncbi:MAG: hypothetical protein IPK10_14390 [Bacteroidetes bacterium]|nr:hypothetical protein [Bacteroidota bacterium]
MSDFFFVILIIFIVFGVFRRYIFFFLMTALSKKVFKEMNKMQDRQSGFNQQQQQQAPIQEPLKGKSNKGVSGDHGEYVDFEEVKD